MKKLNSFTLKDKTIERMKNMIDQTKKDKKKENLIFVFENKIGEILK